MAWRILEHRGSADPTKAFPTLLPRELSVNTANRQIALGHETTGAPLNLIAIRYFDARAQYAADDLVAQVDKVYRAKASVPPGAFNAANWDVIVPATVSAPPDTYFADVKLLMGFEGADASTGAPGMADESPVLRGNATIFGAAQIDTGQFKFGASSLQLTGASYISFADSADWDVGTGPFTLEGWFRFNTATPVNTVLFAQRPAGLIFFFESGKLFLRCEGTTSTNVYTWAPTLDQWYHLAVDRDASSVARIYVDGVMQSKTTGFTANVTGSSAVMAIGSLRPDGLTNYDLIGHVDEARFTNGVARYASDSGFVPPTAAFPRKAPNWAEVFLARTSGLDTKHVYAYTALIDGLVADGIWSKLDVLYIFATQDTATAQLNLISASYPATLNGSPAFTADVGYTGTNNSATKYISTGFNPTTAPSPKFTQNSAHISAWSTADTGANYNVPIGYQTTNASFVCEIFPKTAENAGYFRINSANFGGGFPNAGNNGFGHYVCVRSSSSAIAGYKDGVQVTTGSQASIALTSLPIYVLATNSGGTAIGDSRQLTMASIGSSLTATEATKFYNRLRTYITALGPLIISGTPVTTGNVGTAYAFTVTAGGGMPPHTYSVASGSLPAGITLNSSSGVVSGTPTTIGTSSGIVIRATDALSATADLASFTITVAGAIWTPAALGSDLWAWWDFSAMSQGDGVAVSSVADLSGNSRTLTLSGSPTAKTAAQNSLKALNFAATTSYGTFASASALTSGSFFAVNKSGGNLNGGICDMGTDTQVNHYTYSGQVYSDFLSTTRKSAGSVTVTVWHQVMLWSATGDWGHAMDGTDKFTTTSNTVAARATSYLASDNQTGSWRHQGEFGEVVILNNKPTTLNRQKLEGYFAHKWGLTGSLPGGHPYKSAPPVVTTPLPPTSLTGLIGWWDASVTASLTLSGSNILAVADQSGGGNNLSGDTVKPVYNATGFNSKPAFVFGGQAVGNVFKNTALPLGTGVTLTAWYVGNFAQSSAGVDNPSIISYTGAGQSFDYNNPNSFTTYQGYSSTNQSFGKNNANVSAPSPINVNHRVIFTIDSGGVAKVWVDGVAGAAGTFTGNWTTPGLFYVGRSKSGSAYWAGPVGEVGIATGFSDAATVAGLDLYLKNKWGL